MEVGIFGGSFNPPHIAHLVVAETIRDQFALDRILWIPGYRPPHKPMDSLAPAEDRLEMVRLAVRDNPAFEVSDIEMRLGGVSYTVATVRALQEEYPDVSFVLVLGGDSMLNFDTWHEPKEILERVKLVVYHRAGVRLPDVSVKGPDRVLFAKAPLLEVSGAQIRALRRSGRSIRYLVTDPVLEYIEQRGLYL